MANKKPTRKEIEEELKADEGWLDTILDYAGRPSTTVAALGKEAIDLVQGGEFNGLDALIGGLSGTRKDTWTKNIAQALGTTKPGLPTKIAGTVADMVLDPLNLATGGSAAARQIGKVAAPVRKAIQTAQQAAKAGEYGETAKNVAQTLKSTRGLFSNYAGLAPKEQAVMQLYDAKLHSFDDLVREETQAALAKLPKDLPRHLREAAENEAVRQGKLSYTQKISDAQNALKSAVAKQFSNPSPDLLQALNTRLSPTFAKPLVTELREQFPAVNALMKGDQVWKKSKTRWNPLFYINNELGNVQQALQEASSQGMQGYGDVLKSFAAKYGLGTDEIAGLSEQQIQRLARDRGVRTSVSSIYEGAESGTGKLENTIRKLTGEELVHKTPLQQLRSNISRALDNAQNFVEGGSRDATFRALLKQELRKIRGTPTPAQLSQAADAAALRTTQALFDYEDVTPFVRNLRSLPLVNMPFATWAVKNTPRQVAQLAKNPQFVAKYANIDKNIENAREDSPNYLRDRLAFPMLDTDTDRLFFKPAPPISDINNLGPGFFKGVSPATETMYELLGSGKDTFTGRDLAHESLGFWDRVTSMQPLTPDQALVPELLSALGSAVHPSLDFVERNPKTGKPQTQYWMKKILEEVPFVGQGSKALLSVTNPNQLSNKLPLGSMLPLDLKDKKKIETSKQFERRDAVKRINARKAAKKKTRKSRESVKARVDRWVKGIWHE